MEEDFESFFTVSIARFPRLGYIIWDIFECPQIVIIDNIEESFRCSYDLHTTIFGPPNREIIDNFNPKGEISLSFDLEWKDLITENFTDFSPMDKSARNKEMNNFFCMELNRKDFSSESEYLSKELTQSEIKLLGLKRRILFSQGLGGVGIIEDNELIGCAFIPHIVKQDRFSFAIIRGVWVHKEHRNRGLGYDLSSKMCEIAFQKGFETVTLWVEESNLPAVKIYDKMCFQTKERVIGANCTKKTE